jgi:hypothetical protein
MHLFGGDFLRKFFCMIFYIFLACQMTQFTLDDI